MDYINEALLDSEKEIESKNTSMFSEKYLKWVKQANLPPLTNNQHKFAEWLLLDDNLKAISKIGDLEIVFKSIRSWAKNNQ